MATLYREAAESFVIQRAKGGKYHSLLVMGISSKAGYPHPFAKQAGSRDLSDCPRCPAGGMAQDCCLAGTPGSGSVCTCKGQQNLSKPCWAGSFPIPPRGEVKKAAQEARKTTAMFRG